MPKQIWDSKILWLLVLAIFTIIVIFSAYPVGFFAQQPIGKSYVYANGQRVAIVNEAGTLSYSHSDYLGSARLATSGSAEHIMKYDNAPFGATVTETGYSSALSSYKFTGKEQDDSGLYYYGARYYNPDIGRFVSVDPLYKPVESPYAYAANNPVKYVDPSGKHFQSIQTLSIETDRFDIPAYLKEQTNYFESKIEPLLKRARYPEKNINRIRNLIMTGDMMLLYPFPKDFSPLMGCYMRGGFGLRSESSTAGVFPIFQVSDHRYEIGYSRHGTLVAEIHPETYNLFSRIAIDTQYDDEVTMSIIVHEFKHLLNDEAGITNAVENEYIASKAESTSLIRIGKKPRIGAASGLEGIEAYFKAETQIGYYPKHYGVDWILPTPENRISESR